MIGKFDFHFLLLFRIIKPDKIPGIPDILSGYNIYGYCPPMSITDYKGNITESQRLKIEQCAINILYNRSFPICKGSESRFFFENATEITLDTIAEACFTNKYYLSHLFTRAQGVSVGKYILDKRIKEAKRQLENKDLTVAQIAADVGFNDSSYFCRVFKKETGLTPLAYRKRAVV